MLTRFALPVGLLSLLLLTGHAGAEDRLDASGDPLPRYALARLGTDRLGQHFSQTLEFSPDNRLLLGRDSVNEFRVWEVASGRLLWVSPQVNIRGYVSNTWMSAVWSADGKQVVAASWDGSARLFDAMTGREIQKVQHAMPEGDGRAALQPGGRLLATGGANGFVQVWDVSPGKGQEKMVWSAQPGVESLVWTADGKSLIVLGFNPKVGKQRTLTVWAATGNQQQKHILESNCPEAGWLSPDGSWCVVLSEDRKTLALVDPLTGKESRRIEAEVALEKVALSHGGRYLTATGTDGKIRLWETATGKRKHEFEATPVQLCACAASSDGKLLATAESAGVTIWDATTGKPLHDFPGHRGFRVTVAFSADGKSVVTAARERSRRSGTSYLEEWSVRRWDAATGKEEKVIRQTTEHNPVFLHLSPDARRLAIAYLDGRLELWDPASGKQLSTGEWPMHMIGNFKELDFYHPVFVNDNRVLLGGTSTGVYRLDVETNKPLPFINYPGQNYSFAGVCTLADRLSVVTAAFKNSTVQLAVLDAETGTTKLTLDKQSPSAIGQIAGGVVGWPDGRLVGMFDGGNYVVHELASGARRATFELGGYCTTAALSPDGRFLFVARTDGPNAGWIRVIRVATGEVVREMKDDRRGGLDILVVSPDGKRLASAGVWSSTLLLWDVSDLPAPKPSEGLTEKETNTLWNDLSGDGKTAYRAIARLAADGAPGVKALRRQVKALGKEEKQLAKLIADLDADEFETRERATEALERLGDQARGALRETLDGNPSVEVRRRVTALLEKLEKSETASVELTWRRVVEVLEYNASAEARDWLVELAKESPSKAIAADAKAALERLKQRQR